MLMMLSISSASSIMSVSLSLLSPPLSEEETKEVMSSSMMLP